jgi:hypothetical protein
VVTINSLHLQCKSLSFRKNDEPPPTSSTLISYIFGMDEAVIARLRALRANKKQEIASSNLPTPEEDDKEKNNCIKQSCSTLPIDESNRGYV